MGTNQVPYVNTNQVDILSDQRDIEKPVKTHFIRFKPLVVQFLMSVLT